MNQINQVYQKAIWQATLAGQNLADRINPRLISLSLSENRGDEVDQLEIELSDHDGMIALPELGAVIHFSLGWSGTGLVEKGEFSVSEITYSGAPDTMTLICRSADLSGPLRTRTERSFHAKTIEQIVETIATANALQPVVDKVIAKTKIQHIDQANESDVAFLKRLGDRYDAVATIKDRKLLFLRVTGARTASGQEMPVIQLSRRDGDNHNYHQASRDAYTGVRATWVDTRSARRHSVLVGVKGNAKKLRYTFANEADALAEAQSEWQRIRRGIETMTYTLALGRPDLSVQSRVQFQGLKSHIDPIKWLIKKVQHQLDGDGGLTSVLELETDRSDSDDDAEVSMEDDT